ncbi:hypothetical protein PSY31_24110, partial [Shigella flexneri]|nr:hypothetical protein [Shigella flexneri]
YFLNTSHLFVGMNGGELECLDDSGTTHTILRNRQLFIKLIAYNSSVTTMIGLSQVIKGRGTAKNFCCPMAQHLKS